MRFLGTLVAVAALLVVAGTGTAAAAPNRFDLGIHDPMEPAFGEPDPAGAYDALRAIGVRFVRIPVPWSPTVPTRPADAANHRDPAYQWTSLDQRVRNIASRGLEPLLVPHGAPVWARARRPDGGLRLAPRPDEFAAFATAAARRYSGAEPGLPRVRYWQIWNEPNLTTYLDQDDSVERYRELVTVGYHAIHAVAADNRVVAGGLAPYAFYVGDVPPLRFMRELLCMSAGPRPRAACASRVPFDVWSHHPYTTGGPTHSARSRDAVALGDLPEMAQLLRAAERSGRVAPRGRRPFWATEFAWDTSPPDPGAVPLALHARWVAEAFYRMWRSDISMVVWFQLRDNPRGALNWNQTWQSGLYFRTTDLYADERAKPVRRVFRFPFVALPARGRATVWGRTPSHRAAAVTIERLTGRRWVELTRLRAGPHGIFHRLVAAPRGALLRARVGRHASLPFRVATTRDRRVNTFG